MNQRRTKSAVVGGLAVVVVGLAAATLGQTTDSAGGTGSGGGALGSGGSGGALAQEAPVVTGEPFPYVSVLFVLIAIAVVVGAIRYPWHTVVEVGRMVALTAVVLAILWLLFELLGPGSLPTGQQGSAPLPGMGDADLGGAGSGDGGQSLPVPLLVGLFVAAVVGIGVLALVLRERDAAIPTAPSEDSETLAAIGRSAGRAADRLHSEATDLDNEVYRAWKEMTGHLDLDAPDARTPGEFREAALDAGMAARDVDALTTLFEEVRYGGAAPTPDRETRATDALRHIEERYAEHADDGDEAERTGRDDTGTGGGA